MQRALLPFALMAFLGSCSPATAPKPVATPKAKPIPYQRKIADHSPGAKELLSSPVGELPAVVDVVYRVRPDRRFVNAAADIVEIATGKTIDAVDIDFAGGAWNVRVEGQDAMALPELETFAGALSKLMAWAKRQPVGDRTTFTPADLQSIDAAIDTFYPRFLFSALRRLDQGKALDAAGAARAARAASFLCAQQEDRFDLSDPLRGRALALLAIAKASDDSCCPDSEAILAKAFGYDVEAQPLASKLPRGFAHEWVTGQDPSSNPNAAQEWLVILRRLGRETILDRDNAEMFRGAIDIEAAPALNENSMTDNTWPLGSLVQALMLQAMNGKSSDRVTFDEKSSWRTAIALFDPHAAQREFERLLPAVVNANKSRELDARSVMSFYEANWYAASAQQFSRLNDHLGDVPGTKRFAESLQPGTATGQRVAEWMTNLVDAEYGRFDGPRVQPALASAQLLSGQSRYRLLDAITRSIGTITAEVHRGARDQFRTLDGRPSETLVAGKIAAYPIGDLARRDEYLKSAIDRAPRRFEQEHAEYLATIGDRQGLRRLAEDRSAPMGDRIDALCQMKQFTDVDLHSAFEQIFAEQKYSLSWLSCYWGYLNARKEPVLKERFARKVLENRPDLDAISRANLTSALGNALEAEGKHAEAWKLVEPHVEVGSANILLTAASLLQRLGRAEESLEIGRQLIERYPDAETSSEWAMVLWRMGRNDEAAALFNPARHAFAVVLAEEKVPTDFLATFSDSDLPRALAAYDALIKAGPSPYLLRAIADAAFAQKRWDLGLALNDRYLKMPAIRAEGGRQAGAYANSFEALKETKGKAEAMQWLLAAFPNPNVDLLIQLFMAHRFDLLTEFVAAHPPAGKQLETASIVAASLAYQHVPLADDRWALVRRLMPEKVGVQDQTIALSVRHLMHEVDAATVARSVVTANNRSEAAFFLGTEAVAENDFDSALSMYLAATDGPWGYPTTSWAITRLYEWRAKQRSWKDIARAGIL
jgi:tetratricopeptide (TPR) repeat protein